MRTIFSGRNIFSFALLLVVTALRSLVSPGMWARGEVIRQLVRIGVQAVGMVSLVCLCIGLILAMQSAPQLLKFGMEQVVPTIVLTALVKEMAPLLTAIIVIGRSGSAIAAELGTMKVSDEIEAIRVMGIDPIEFLIMPRFWALFLMMPVLSIFGTYVGLLGGWLYCFPALSIPTPYFVEMALTGPSPMDLWISVIKSSVFGFLVVTIGCWCGLSVQGGAEGVGRATTSAVALSILAILVADVILNLLIGLLP